MPEPTSNYFTYPNKNVTDYVRFDVLECAPPLNSSLFASGWEPMTNQMTAQSLVTQIPDEDNDILVTDYSKLKILIGGSKE